MTPTVPLSRLIFEPPTYHYKVGVAFLAWLNGLQPQFAMLGGLERQRPAGHLIRVFELAAAARGAEPAPAWPSSGWARCWLVRPPGRDERRDRA